MGQKVNPIGFRLAVNKDWRSKWYATGQDYATKLHEDLVMRKYIKEQLMSAAVSSIVIERAWNSVRITVHTARPGLVIGRKGEEIEKIRQYLQSLCGASTQVNIDIVEIRSPETDAQLIAENVAVQLERRVSFRRAMKRAVQVAMERGADGIRIRINGSALHGLRIQIGLQNHHGRHHIHLFLAVFAAHVRLEQRVLSQHGGHPLVVIRNDKPRFFQLFGQLRDLFCLKSL